MKKYVLTLGALLLLALFLAACASPPTPTEVAPCPTAAPCPDCPAPPEPPPCPEAVVDPVPYEAEWVGSAHADAEAEAFVHWNEDDPAEVPTSCAKCHSTTGYMDFLGADGTAAGTVDAAQPTGQVIECQACHNDAATAMTSVVFPSGAEITGLGGEARCMQCHQGRASKVQVDETLTELGIADNLDTVTAELGFINIHYFPAAATLYGTAVKGGYEYDGNTYDFKNDHVAGYDTCIGCHNQHTLELKLEECAVCHQGVASVEDVKNIRMAGSLKDYDGDGDIEEGMFYELEGLQEMLLQAIQAYGAEVAGTPIAYNVEAYPYFFVDTNGDGQVGDDESDSYNAWTGRLLKAAYNYQMAAKDPGDFAHGGKYIVQLLYDSIEDLNTVVASPVDLSTANRLDAGHFAGSEEAFRHWDADGGEVPGDCAKCHSRGGVPMFLKEAGEQRDGVSGRTTTQHVSNGLNCATCHNDLSTFTRFTVDAVKFPPNNLAGVTPNGEVLTFGEGEDANICILCHQGRESTATVNAKIAASGAGDDEVSESLSFSNVHYFAAGGTLFGDEAKVAYQYEGNEYNPRHPHINVGITCVKCHDVHALEVEIEFCSGCHPSVESEADLASIRMDPTDWDGDGDTTEGIAGEMSGFEERLYAALQTYARDTAGSPILYNGGQYPYFFGDANDNGEIDEGEGTYNAWTPNLLRAAFNYQYSQKDPGAFAHNGQYLLQVLYDSIQGVGGDVSGLTRP